MSPRKRKVATNAKGNSGKEDSAATIPPSSSSSSALYNAIVAGIQQRANPQTKAGFTNYVKGTTWMGCKMPVVREAVQEVTRRKRKSKSKGKQKKKAASLSHNNHFPPGMLLDAAVSLLQHEACDVKLAGMLVLSEQMELEDLATASTLQRLERDVLLQNKLDDWSSADWFAMKVLQKIVFADVDDDDDSSIAMRVLNFTNVADTADRNYLYVRRCGVVPFLDYYKHRDKLPPRFGTKLVDACEKSLLTSPDERFTQTGIAWVLRYVLLQPEEKDYAYKMIVQHGALWTKEAKKSLTEKLPKNDPRRKKILELE
ncbi:MAG: hypothetical protein SGARI_004457 [Bacillariaceae sp.]